MVVPVAAGALFCPSHGSPSPAASATDTGGSSGEGSVSPSELSDDAYQTIADTVELVPSLRKEDNVVQAIVVLIGTLVGAVSRQTLPCKVQVRPRS